MVDDEEQGGLGATRVDCMPVLSRPKPERVGTQAGYWGTNRYRCRLRLFREVGGKEKMFAT